jgi:hypothetical protein
MAKMKMVNIEICFDIESTTASYSRSSVGMVDSTGIQIGNPFNNTTSIISNFPTIYQPELTINENQPEKRSFNFDWAGELSELRGTINSVELAHESLKWR